MILIDNNHKLNVNKFNNNTTNKLHKKTKYSITTMVLSAVADL